MIIIKKKEMADHEGMFICEYGESGVGKTVSTLQSIPDPVLWLTFEPRDFNKAMAAAKRPKLRYELAVYEHFIDLIEFINDPDNFSKFRSIFVDGLSYFHNIIMPTEIQTEEFDKSAEKQIRAYTKITMPQQGERNQAVFRVLNLLGTNAVAQGKIVIISCLEMERPKYNRELTAGPALGGKEVPDNFPGFFDLIGRITPNEDDNEEIIYPPMISFESDGGFLAKYTGGAGKKYGPLHWEKIFKKLSGTKAKPKPKPPAELDTSKGGEKED